MIDLAEFLGARLDEDERTARAATPGPWAAAASEVRGTEPWPHHPDWSTLAARFTRSADGEHIARHDPARVLREVAAKRAILADHAPQVRGARKSCSRCSFGNSLGAAWPCLTVERLAAAYSDHPDYIASRRRAG